MGGFETSLFVNGPAVKDDFICHVCHCVFDKPMSVCAEGHTFCESCLKEWKKRNDSCPNCRTQMHAVPVLNRIVQNMIMELQVKCPESRSEPEVKRGKPNDEEEQNNKLCCDWEGTLSDYVDKHKVKECKFGKVKCECRMMIRAYNLEEHKSKECSARRVTCELCDESMKHSLLASHQSRRCPKAITKCPHCNEEMERQALGKLTFGKKLELVHTGHLAVCPKLKVRCPFEKLGCRAFVARQDMKQHHADCGDMHAKLVVDQFETIKDGKYWTAQCMEWRVQQSRLRQMQRNRTLVLKSQAIRVGEYRTYLRLKVDSENKMVVHVCVKNYELHPRIDKLRFELEGLLTNELEVEQSESQVMKVDDDVAYAGGTMKVTRYADEDYADSLGMFPLTIDEAIATLMGDEMTINAWFRLTGPERVLVEEDRS